MKMPAADTIPVLGDDVFTYTLTDSDPDDDDTHSLLLKLEHSSGTNSDSVNEDELKQDLAMELADTLELIIH